LTCGKSYPMGIGGTAHRKVNWLGHMEVSRRGNGTRAFLSLLSGRKSKPDQRIAFSEEGRKIPISQKNPHLVEIRRKAVEPGEGLARRTGPRAARRRKLGDALLRKTKKNAVTWVRPLLEGRRRADSVGRRAPGVAGEKDSLRGEGPGWAVGSSPQRLSARRG